MDSEKICKFSSFANLSAPPRWKFTTGLIPRQYRRRIFSTGAVLAQIWNKHGLPPTRLRKVTWLEVVHRYWRSTGHWYHASTEICTGVLLASLRSRLLSDTWSQDWGCTMPVPCQPSARYHLSSTGIAPYLQLARYCVVCKYCHESDFSTWARARDSVIALRVRCSVSFTYKFFNSFLISNEKGNSIYLGLYRS